MDRVNTFAPSVLNLFLPRLDAGCLVPFIIRYSESINIIVMLRRTILQNILRLMYGVDAECSQRKRLSCVILIPLNSPWGCDVDTGAPHAFPETNILRKYTASPARICPREWLRVCFIPRPRFLRYHPNPMGSSF